MPEPGTPQNAVDPLLARPPAVVDPAEDDDLLDLPPDVDETRPDPTRFEWNATKRKAAVLLARDELTDREIAKQLGVNRCQFYVWKKHPEFKARVEQLSVQMGDVARRYELGKLARRLEVLTDIWHRILRVIEQRAADPSMANVPGGDTGLIMRERKGVGKGKDFQLIEEFVPDVGLLRELREYQKAAAQELGQWVEKAGKGKNPGVEVNINNNVVTGDNDVIAKIIKYRDIIEQLGAPIDPATLEYHRQLVDGANTGGPLSGNRGGQPVDPQGA